MDRTIRRPGHPHHSLGHGHLDPGDPYTLADLAGDAAAVLDGHGVAAAHIVGTSLGAAVGQWLAVHRASRVRTLTAMAASPMGHRPGPAWARAMAGQSAVATELPPPTAAFLCHLLASAQAPRTTRQDRLDADVRTWRMLNGDILPFHEAAARSFVERCHARAANLAAALNHDLAGRRFGDDRRAPLSAVTAPTLVLHAVRIRSSRRPTVRHSRHRSRARDWRWCPAWGTIRSSHPGSPSGSLNRSPITRPDGVGGAAERMENSVNIDVVIVGGGPVGLLLAGELMLAGVRPVVLEQSSKPSTAYRANAVIGQVVRFLDHRGLYRSFGGQGDRPQPAPAFLFGGLPLSLSGLADHPLHGLQIRQQRLESQLEQWARDLGVHLLGWKLAAQVHGWAPAGLLDSYQTERRPAAERVTLHTQAQLALMSPGPAVTALRQVVAELLETPAVTGQVSDLLAGSDVRYRMHSGTPHALTGRFAPDLDLRIGSGQTRLAELARPGRSLLVDLTGAGQLADLAGPWRDRVDLVAAHAPAPPAAAFLVRPDGYVAWALGPDGAAQLPEALTTWFGDPRRPG